MLEKLQAIKERWEEVEAELSKPETINDMKRFAKLNKEYKDLSKIVEQYHIYKNMVSNIETNKDILANEKDQELREMAKEELDLLLGQKEEKEEEIRLMQL
jgi:peptide chain release factor 1